MNHNFTDEEISAAWDQLARVEAYLTQRTDIAFVAYRNYEQRTCHLTPIPDLFPDLYEAWQDAGDALWLVRDYIKGRFHQPRWLTRTTMEQIMQREGA